MPDDGSKWAKFLTSMRRNPKMQLILAMPEGDALKCIWVDLILLAAEVCDRGYIYISPGVPYTSEELGAVLDRQPNIVRLAITTFERYKMLTTDDKGILIKNFAITQNIEAMEHYRELARNRNRAYRERKKTPRLNTQLPEKAESQAQRDVSVTSRDGVDKIRRDYIREEDGEIWNNVLKFLKQKMSEKNFKAWFADAVCLQINDTEFEIGVRREDQAAHIEQTQRDLVENVIASVVGKPLKLKVLLFEERSFTSEFNT